MPGASRSIRTQHHRHLASALLTGIRHAGTPQADWLDPYARICRGDGHCQYRAASTRLFPASRTPAGVDCGMDLTIPRQTNSPGQDDSIADYHRNYRRISAPYVIRGPRRFVKRRLALTTTPPRWNATAYESLTKPRAVRSWPAVGLARMVNPSRSHPAVCALAGRCLVYAAGICNAVAKTMRTGPSNLPACPAWANYPFSRAEPVRWSGP